MEAKRSEMAVATQSRENAKAPTSVVNEAAPCDDVFRIEEIDVVLAESMMTMRC